MIGEKSTATPTTEITCYDDLIAVFQTRKTALDLSNRVLEERSGLQSGYVGKLLGPGRVRLLGWYSLWVLFRNLGLKLAVVDHPQYLAEIEQRDGPIPPRDSVHLNKGAIRLSPTMKNRMMSELGKAGYRGFLANRPPAKHHRRIGILGGKKAAANLTPLQRVNRARNAAIKRWERKRAREAAQSQPTPNPHA